jgi:hypothetical protein
MKLLKAEIYSARQHTRTEPMAEDDGLRRSAERAKQAVGWGRRGEGCISRTCRPPIDESLTRTYPSGKVAN